MTIQEIKELIEQLNEFQMENSCEFNTISLNNELERRGIKNEIVSGDLIIRNRLGREIKFIQGANKKPIGHSWIIATIEGQTCLIESSYLGEFHIGCMIEKITNSKDKIILNVDNQTYEYIYRNDGNTYT
jgi:hypothetical protein